MKKMVLFVALCTLTVSMYAQGYSVDDVAADFKLKNIDDKMVSLSDYNKEKGVILIFTCNHCPYSVLYEDRIIELDKEFKAKGFPVIAINPNDPAQYADDSFENMKIRAQEKGFTFPYIFDENQEVYPVYGALKTPHVYVLKKEKKEFKVAYIGAIDNNAKDASKVTKMYVKDAVINLLAGKKANPETTKAIGCSIKAKK